MDKPLRRHRAKHIANWLAGDIHLGANDHGWDPSEIISHIAANGTAAHPFMQPAIEEAKGMIDFEVLYSRTNWSDVQIQQRLQQAEKSEILVPDRIPLDLIRNLPNG